MVLQGQQPGEKKLDDLFGGGQFWENVDWSRTRAYAMGLGQIYFNLRGRESKGIVSPGAEAAALADEMRTRLLALTDPDDGARIVRDGLQARRRVFGRVPAERVGAAGRDGGRLPRLLADRPRRRAAGHRLSEHEEVERRPRRLRLRDDVRRAAVEPAHRAPAPSILDIAPTVLKYFGLEIPKDIDGKPLF